MLFLTATEAEISAMSNAEFIDCIPDIGKLTDLKSNQRDALLSKAKTVILINYSSYKDYQYIFILSNFCFYQL
jgi:hypothetical protein